eukprot:2461646-Prymnesium_polylepis.1
MHRTIFPNYARTALRTLRMRLAVARPARGRGTDTAQRRVQRRTRTNTPAVPHSTHCLRSPLLATSASPVLFGRTVAASVPPRTLYLPRSLTCGPANKGLRSRRLWHWHVLRVLSVPPSQPPPP